MNSAVQLISRSRVMSLRRVSCCFMSWQCLMRISTDLSGPISITASPQAASAGRVYPISFCPMAAGLNSVKGSVNWLVLKKAVYHWYMQCLILAVEQWGCSQPPTPKSSVWNYLICPFTQMGRERERGEAQNRDPMYNVQNMWIGFTSHVFLLHSSWAKHQFSSKINPW